MTRSVSDMWRRIAFATSGDPEGFAAAIAGLEIGFVLISVIGAGRRSLVDIIPGGIDRQVFGNPFTQFSCSESKSSSRSCVRLPFLIETEVSLVGGNEVGLKCVRRAHCRHQSLEHRVESSLLNLLLQIQRQSCSNDCLLVAGHRQLLTQFELRDTFITI